MCWVCLNKTWVWNYNQPPNQMQVHFGWSCKICFLCQQDLTCSQPLALFHKNLDRCQNSYNCSGRGRTLDVCVSVAGKHQVSFLVWMVQSVLEVSLWCQTLLCDLLFQHRAWKHSALCVWESALYKLIERVQAARLTCTNTHTHAASDTFGCCLTWPPA